MNIPNDPMILFSWLNTQLRDTGLTLEDFCADRELDADALTEKLEAAGFRYDADKRCFR